LIGGREGDANVAAGTKKTVLNEKKIVKKNSLSNIKTCSKGPRGE